MNEPTVMQGEYRVKISKTPLYSKDAPRRRKGPRAKFLDLMIQSPAYSEMADRALDNFMEDRILPSQWRDRFHTAPDSGELRMLKASFQLAVADLLAGPGKATTQISRRQQAYLGAVEFFEDTESTGLFSLRTYCELNDMDPLAVSKQALAKADTGAVRLYRHPVLPHPQHPIGDPTNEAERKRSHIRRHWRQYRANALEKYRERQEEKRKNGDVL